MRRNDARRAALVDAAIDVLADRGARGLTFRAIDSVAAVPPGTASNYFANRDDLFSQIGSRIFSRFQPDAAALAAGRGAVTDREGLKAVMRQAVKRVSSDRTGYLALLELRLEATRRPGLRPALAELVDSDVQENIAGLEASGLPGDAAGVRLLYMTLNWLVMDRLTLPERYPDDAVDSWVDAAVSRLLPRNP